MRKFGLLCLAIVLALGALGVGYATWTDTITIQGSVTTGSVCLQIEDWEEVNSCTASQYAAVPDKNWVGWTYTQGATSCPPSYTFDSKPCTDKDVAYFEFTPMKADGTVIAPEDIDTIPVEKLKITIKNAYPHFLGRVTFHVCNCGTVPVMLDPLEPEDITQSDFLIIEYNNGGDQLEPGVCHEISLWIGVVQHQGYFATPGTASSYVVDDITKPMLPMNAGAPGGPPALSFTFDVTGEQWEECP